MYSAIPEDTSLLYLWEQRTLYLGERYGLSEVSQAAASLLIGLEGDLDFWTPNHPEKIRTRSVLIPAGASANADNFGKPVAQLYLDPLNKDYNALASLMQGGVDGFYFDSAIFSTQLSSLLTIYKQQLSPADAYQELITHILKISAESHKLSEIEEKILEVISIIKSQPTENHSSQFLASQVGLTENQLQRYFKASVGIPIRRYRLWHRLFITATLMSFGMSLTEASLEAGFSDSSHFNHTFRSMLGMKPSFVLKRRDHIRIFIGGDNDF